MIDMRVRDGGAAADYTRMLSMYSLGTVPMEFLKRVLAKHE